MGDGDKIRCHFRTKNVRSKSELPDEGTITKVHTDEGMTIDIKFDDGSTQTWIKRDWVLQALLTIRDNPHRRNDPIDYEYWKKTSRPGPGMKQLNKFSRSIPERLNRYPKPPPAPASSRNRYRYSGRRRVLEDLMQEIEDAK